MDVFASSPLSSSPAWQPNPFAADVCTTLFEVAENRSVPAMNREVLQRVADAIEHLGGRAGRSRSEKPVLLLTAPRAGYGKTHLLGRVAAMAEESQAVAMQMVFRSDSDVTWAGASHEAVEALRHLPGKTPDWPRLREICAGIFASMVLRLIHNGRLPCANQEQALRVLSADPTDLFRDGTQARMIGDWLKEHYAQLRKPLTGLVHALPNAGVVDGWVDAVFAAAHDGSMASLEVVVGLASGSRPAFELWLRMVTLWRPVVLFVDLQDGFYRQENSGLRIATMLLELAELEGVNVVLSLNEDVWQATFANHLPSALEDRLTASQFLLRGLSAADAADLMRLRLHEGQVPEAQARRFELFLDVTRHFQGRPEGSISARSFLRYSAMQWDAFQHTKVRGHEPMTPMDSTEESKESLLGQDEPPGFSLLDDDEPPVPPIFEAEDALRMKTLLRGLNEPMPAMVNTSFAPPSPVSSPHADWNDFVEPASPPHASRTLGDLRERLDRLRSPLAPAAGVLYEPADPTTSGTTARPTDALNEASPPPDQAGCDKIGP